MTGTLRILTVCTHNRTRSVIAAALLDHHLRDADLDHQVVSAGLNPAPDLSGRNEVSSHLARHGVRVAPHQSRRVDAEVVFDADVILTAEPDHVVWIAGNWADAFERTFTLPEAAELTRTLAPVDGFDQWRASLAARRPPARAYLERGAIPMITDPTGRPAEIWDAVIVAIDRDCRTIVDALV